MCISWTIKCLTIQQYNGLGKYVIEKSRGKYNFVSIKPMWPLKASVGNTGIKGFITIQAVSNNFVVLGFYAVSIGS